MAFTNIAFIACPEFSNGYAGRLKKSANKMYGIIMRMHHIQYGTTTIIQR